MTSPNIKEPNIFYGTPEENAEDWLALFQEISEVNKWKASRLPYVKLYLEVYLYVFRDSKAMAAS